VFGTLAGLPPGHFYGPSTISKDSTDLFLFLPGRVSGKVVVRGLSTPVEGIRVIGHQREIPWKVVGKISWSAVPGLVYIDVPADLQDEHLTVLRVKLKGPLRLYRGEGGL
jgi:alpha-L-fucosidase